ncbi:MAG: amino acid synthesis family protein, partial [Ottowia sp.]|nr:amino acid synthesis family protein [Ottowia sp.]
AMDVPREAVATYGKGAIVGAAGELEHGALWHVPGGYAMRELLGWKGDRAAYVAGQGSGTT